MEKDDRHAQEAASGRSIAASVSSEGGPFGYGATATGTRASRPVDETDSALRCSWALRSSGNAHLQPSATIGLLPGWERAYDVATQFSPRSTSPAIACELSAATP